MKKLLCSLLLAFACSESLFAQKGMQGIGVKGYMCLGGFTAGYGGPKNHSTIGGGLEYQYFLTEAIRVKPSVTFFSKEYYSMSEFSAALSLDYLIPVSRQFRPYLDLSVRYADLNCKGDGVAFSQENDGKGFTFGGGVGIDIRLSYHISMQAEVVALWGQGKQSMHSEGDKRYESVKVKKPVWLPSVGLTYNF